MWQQFSEHLRPRLNPNENATFLTFENTRNDAKLSMIGALNKATANKMALSSKLRSAKCFFLLDLDLRL